MGENELQVHTATSVERFNPDKATTYLRLASELSASNIIPERYQGKPANVLVALYRSDRLDVDPFFYMETSFQIKGRTGHEAKFKIGLINKSGLFADPIMWDFSGKIDRDSKGNVLRSSNRTCRAYATLKSTGVTLSQTLSIQTAFLKGWMDQNPNWHQITDEMMQYRSAAFFGNMYCPEILMGVKDRYELEDIQDAEAIEITETGNDVFVKGVEVSTDVEPVVDPANQVIVEFKTESVAVEKNNNVDTQEKPEVKEVEKTEVARGTEKEIPKNPPTDPTAFRAWLEMEFCDEIEILEKFLLLKGWLKHGQKIGDLSLSWSEKFREIWSKFEPAYNGFKSRIEVKK